MAPFFHIRLTFFICQAELVLIYMVLIDQISAGLFLIHMFFCAGVYCVQIFNKEYCVKFIL
jgi:hypothetical protein